MSFMRGMGRWLLAILMGLAFGVWVAVATLQMTVLNREVAKGWLQDSGLYANLIDTIPFQVDNGDTGGRKTFITTEDIQGALKKTFPPSYIQTHAETIIDSAYDWMAAKSDKVSFSIPINDKMTDFATNLAAQIQPRLATMPACSSVMSSNDGQPTCIPRGLSIAQFAAQLSDITKTDGDNFLSKPITQDSFGNTETHLGWLPKVVSQLGWVSWVLPILGVLCGAGYVLLSDSKLRGLRVVGRRVFFQGWIAAAFGGAVWYFGSRLSIASLVSGADGSSESAVTLAAVTQLIDPILHVILPVFGQTMLLLSGGLAIVGGVVWLTAIMLLRRDKDNKDHFLHTENTPNPLLSPDTDDKDDKKDADTPEEPKDKPKEQPKPESPKPTPPKPPKPPRPLVM
jgi:hypothetical protein